MMALIPFKKEHFDSLSSQRSISVIESKLSDEQKYALQDSGRTFTITKDGLPIACGGVAEYWENRGEAWIVLNSSVCKANFIRFHRLVKKYLDSVNIRRMEAAVVVDFKSARRWVELLGFNLECNLLEAYLPSGDDCALYSRIRRH